MTKYSFEVDGKTYDVPTEIGEIVEYIEDFLVKNKKSTALVFEQKELKTATIFSNLPKDFNDEIAKMAEEYLENNKIYGEKTFCGEVKVPTKVRKPLKVCIIKI